MADDTLPQTTDAGLFGAPWENRFQAWLDMLSDEERGGDPLRLLAQFAEEEASDDDELEPDALVRRWMLEAEDAC